MVKSDKTRPVSFKVITDIKFQLFFFFSPQNSCLLQSSELCWCWLRYHSPPALSPASPYGYLTRTQITGFLHKLCGLKWKSEWQTCSVMISKVPHGLSMRQALTKVGSNIDAEIPIHIIPKYSYSCPYSSMLLGSSSADCQTTQGRGFVMLIHIIKHYRQK